MRKYLWFLPAIGTCGAMGRSVFEFNRDCPAMCVFLVGMAVAFFFATVFTGHE